MVDTVVSVDHVRSAQKKSRHADGNVVTETPDALRECVNAGECVVNENGRKKVLGRKEKRAPTW